MKRITQFLALLVLLGTAHMAGAQAIRYTSIVDESTVLGMARQLKMTGAGVACTGPVAGRVTCTIAGGGGSTANFTFTTDDIKSSTNGEIYFGTANSIRFFVKSSGAETPSLSVNGGVPTLDVLGGGPLSIGPSVTSIVEGHGTLMGKLTLGATVVNSLAGAVNNGICMTSGDGHGTVCASDSYGSDVTYDGKGLVVVGSGSYINGNLILDSELHFPGSSLISQLGNTLAFQASGAGAGTTGHAFYLLGTSTTSGVAGLSVNTSGSSAGQLDVATNSGVANVNGYGEHLQCDGTCTTGNVVVWTAGGNKVTDAGASANLTTIAGVALQDDTTGFIVVARRGRTLTNCVAGVVSRNLVGTSGGTAGSVGATTPGVGSLVGRATEDRGNTVAGKCIVDLTLN